MRGQKKRRKRSASGVIALDGANFAWSLLSEPQWSPEGGLIGLRFSIQLEGGGHRELILEYPFPDKRTGNGSPQLPQRPKFTIDAIESSITRAMAAGWDPQSRGRSFLFKVED